MCRLFMVILRGLNGCGLLVFILLFLLMMLLMLWLRC